MPDLAITAANVTADDGAVNKYIGTAGATVTAGQACYVDTANSNVLKLAQSDGTALEATVKGIAMHGAASGQPLTLATSGDIDLGATLTVGATYVLSQTAGGIAPIADLATGDFVSHIGIGDAADNLSIGIKNSGVEVPA